MAGKFTRRLLFLLAAAGAGLALLNGAALACLGWFYEPALPRRLGGEG